jgi:hypothetical protein
VLPLTLTSVLHDALRFDHRELAQLALSQLMMLARKTYDPVEPIVGHQSMSARR